MSGGSALTVFALRSESVGRRRWMTLAATDSWDMGADDERESNEWMR